MKFANLFKRGGRTTITISNINIYWKGNIHALPGIVSHERAFKVKVPFKNKKTETLSFLKQQERKPERIEKVETSKPFSITGVEPPLPISIPEGESVDIDISVEGPEFNYSGPLTLKLGTTAEEKIHVELPEIFLVKGDKRVRVNEHGEVHNLMKNQVFEVSIQMYKALTFGDKVSVVKTSKPFEFEGTSPQLPFKIDDRSSYVVTFMIKAPDFDYSGPLEIEVSD